MQKLDITFNSSPCFNLLHSGVVLGSIVWIITLTCSIGLKIALIAAVLIYGFFIQRKIHYWQAILFDGKDWFLRHEGELFPIKITGDSTVTTALTILRFTFPEDRRRYTHLIFKDTMSAENYRRLIVQLHN